MSNDEIRNQMNAAIVNAKQAGNAEAVAKMEIAREWLTNPDFRQRLSQHIWDLNRAHQRELAPHSPDGRWNALDSID